MAQTVLQQVLILAAMMMLGFLLGKLGKVERKGADLLSMLLLDVFFPCNICLLYTSPSPRDISGSRMPSSA